MRGLSAAKTPPRAPNAALAFLRCARYRVHARPRARAPRSVGARGALRRLRRLGWRPRRPGARQPRRERVAGGRRGTFRAGRPSPREPSAGEGARCPARATGATAAAARSEAPAPGARAPRRVERPPTCAPGSPRAVTTPSASGAVRPRKGAARPCKRLLLRCAAGSSVSPTARHAARRIIEGCWTLSGALFFVSCNWFCESVTVGARRDFFFARTTQPFGRVRTPGTDQTTRKRVSRRSTSNKRGTPDRRAVNIAESCCMWTTYRNTMHHAWRHRMCFGKVLERLRWKSKQFSGRIRSPTTC